LFSDSAPGPAVCDAAQSPPPARAEEGDADLEAMGIQVRRRPEHESALYWAEELRKATTPERKRECHENMVRSVMAM